MSFNHGGQRRTSVTPCGFITAGSPREAEGKMRIHAKVCPICSAMGIHKKPVPKFNSEANDKVAGKKGWKQTPVEKMVGTTF